MLPHEDNVLNKFRIWKERHIQMRENRSSHLVGWKTHPTIVPRSGFELTTSRSPWQTERVEQIMGHGYWGFGPHTGPNREERLSEARRWLCISSYIAGGVHIKNYFLNISFSLLLKLYVMEICLKMRSFSKAALALRGTRADKIGAETASKHAPWKAGFTEECCASHRLTYVQEANGFPSSSREESRHWGKAQFL